MSNIFLPKKLTRDNRKNPDVVVKNTSNRKAILEKRKGIYIVYHRHLCLYVGASKNLHLRTSRFFMPPDRVMIESFYIRAIMTAVHKSEFQLSLLKIAVVFMDKNSILEISDAEQYFIKKHRPILNCPHSHYSNQYQKGNLK